MTKRCWKSVYMGQTKQRIPKDIFVGRIVLEIGVRTDVLSFNGGANRLSKMFEKLSMVTASFTKEFCASRNGYLIQKADMKSIGKVKQMFYSCHSITIMKQKGIHSLWVFLKWVNRDFIHVLYLMVIWHKLF